MSSSKGILLLAYGKPCYGRAAYNMATSLKNFDKDISICLLRDHAAFAKDNFDFSVFDEQITIEKEDIINPAFAKTKVYDYSPYDETLYLDVDGCALKSVAPLMDKCSESKNYFSTVVFDTITKDGGGESNLIWAKKEDVWQHYQLNGEKLPTTQTSVFFFKKQKETKELFDKWRYNLQTNPLPFEKLLSSWGGTQPDELYLSVTLAQIGIAPSIGNDVMFFGQKMDERSRTKLAEDFYFLSIYGGKGFTRIDYVDWYERLIIRYASNRGSNIFFKTQYVFEDKHSNGSRAVLGAKPVQRITTIKNEAIIPISKTKLIDKKNLIPAYNFIDGSTIRPTNYFNCSFIEYNGGYYFAYRMEAKPFCTRMKIGLCKLNKDFTIVSDTNVLPTLHSDLRGFAKTFHVEDPRLFIFNNKLYLSYTDGYQMAQAEINSETLQAKESFYIDKPHKNRTEKNWTFFESENKLLSVYSINPHTIFEIDGNKFTEKYNERFTHAWHYGELRGGTTPIKYGDNYISFFHSSLDIKYKGMPGKQYFMGAYIFDGKAPYKPIYITNKPFVEGELTDDSIPRLSNRIFVVFPSGVIKKEKSFFVSFGYNDMECRYVEITEMMLKENLKPII